MPVVKILTLNLHCLVEENLNDKQRQIAKKIDDLDVDIVFLQEVAQSFDAPMVDEGLRSDNYALQLQQRLAKQNKFYHLYYEPFKESFGKYDEGLAFLSKVELTYDTVKRISRTNQYRDWHTRYVMTYHVTIGSTKIYIANTHFGWTDETERFQDQVDQACSTIPSGELGLLVGDFNVKPDSVEYQYLLSKHLVDLFDVPEFANRPTHIDYIDVHKKAARIDYMMSTTPLKVSERKILFEEKPVSDHFGLYLSFPVK